MRRQIRAILIKEGIPGFTSKMGIAGQDVYLKVGFCRVRDSSGETLPPQLVYVDVTLSAIRSHEDFMPTHAQTTLAATKTDDARAMIELLCRQANELLASGAWTVSDLIESWKGTSFDPCGICRFPEILVGDTREARYGTVKSPLDAVGKLIEVRLPVWQKAVAHELVDDGSGSIGPAAGVPAGTVVEGDDAASLDLAGLADGQDKR